MTLLPIAANSGYPWSTIVELQITFPDQKHFLGTGVMIDSYHVLTAGHLAYSAADGGFASSILATPEINGWNAPFGSAWMTHETTDNTWIAYSRAHPGLTAPGDRDVALLALDRPIGNLSGWMAIGYDNNNADFAAGTIMATAGYPSAGGYNGFQEEFGGGPIAGLSPDASAIEYLQSSITAYAGQSGSPVFKVSPSTGLLVAYGIHVGGTGTATSLNVATRITQSVFNEINGWIAQDNAVRHPSGIGKAGQATAPPSAPVPLTTAPADLPIVLGLAVPAVKPPRLAFPTLGS